MKSKNFENFHIRPFVESLTRSLSITQRSCGIVREHNRGPSIDSEATARCQRRIISPLPFFSSPSFILCVLKASAANSFRLHCSRHQISDRNFREMEASPRVTAFSIRCQRFSPFRSYQTFRSTNAIKRSKTSHNLDEC